jgi:hypothetical protein
MHLSDIRKVTLHYIGSYPESYLIPTAEVPRFVDASKRLHWKPGENPHNGDDAARIWRITVATLGARGPYWWTTPDLQNNDDPAGARIFDIESEQVVFVDEAVVNRWHAEEAEAEAAHYRERESEAAHRYGTDG